MAEFKLKQTAEEVQRAVDNALSFGEFPTGGDTLYWDGNTEGLVSGTGIADGGEKVDMYHKISDAVPTKNDFVNGFTFAVKNPNDGKDVNVEYSASDAQSSFSDDGFALLADGYFAIIPLGGYIFIFDEVEITCPEPGVYHIAPMMGVHAHTLTIPGYTGFPVTKKIEQKYLPGAVVLYLDAEEEPYLCSDSEGTERITKAQLKSFFESGRAIYFCNPILTEGAFAPLSIFINDSYTFGAAFLQYRELNELFYTAEYVPEG